FDTHTWTEIKAKDESKLPSKRCKHSACIYDNMMYIFGGWDSSLAFISVHVCVSKSNLNKSLYRCSPKPPNIYIEPL
ncbi:unnamed protein product, partial [Rotaria sp. Silwood1]